MEILYFYCTILPKGKKDHPKNYQRTVICGIINEEKTDLRIGAAMCSGKDIFKKRVGREKAKGRALSTAESRVFSIPADMQGKTNLEFVKIAKTFILPKLGTRVLLPFEVKRRERQNRLKPANTGGTLEVSV